MENKLLSDRRTFLKIATALGFTSGATEIGSGQQRRNELLVGVSPSAASVRQATERAVPSEARVVGENERLGYATVELPKNTTADAKAATVSSLERRAGIEYVESNAVYEALYAPSDLRFDEQYAPQMVNAPTAWDSTLGSRDVTIAVVDTGIAYNHPDLEENFGTNIGRDFVDSDGDPAPDVPTDEYHGTHVAGVAAATIDNGDGVAGISNSTLLSVRALNESQSGYTSDIADGVQWAADQGADIINLSIGGGGYTQTLQNAVSYASEQGAVLVAAAGNTSGGSVTYPGAYDECIAVSALDPDGSIANYSSRGSKVELSAPGTNILSTWIDSGYNKLSGTSAAAPVVSGVVALILSKKNLSNSEVRTQLKNTAIDVGLSDEKQGSGQVNAAAAISASSSSLHTLEIHGVDTRTEYSFSVSDTFSKNTGLTPEDNIDGNTATGAVGSGQDSYTFSGEVTDFSMSSDADLVLDGQEISVTEFLPRTLTVEGGDSRSEYSFAVTGGISGRGGHSSEDHIDIENGRVDGAVGGGRDLYAFSGDIINLNVDGDATVHIDGDEARKLEIHGVDTRTEYSFSVSSTFANNTGLTPEDDITDNTATGAVGGGQDSYAFFGEVIDFSMSSDADLVLDGQEISVTEFLPRTLTVEGTGSRSDYSFAVTGGISGRMGHSREDYIDIENGRVNGAVGGGRDYYAFSEELIDIDVDGNANVYLDGELISTERPTIGVYSGLSDSDFETIARMEEWQNDPYAVQNLFVPWNPDDGHMNWLFDRVLPRIWNAGRVPLITWEPYTPSAQTASIDTASLVEREEYDAYIQSLADTTPDDIEVRIASGEYDTYIERWANRLQESLASSSDRQAYIRLAHEMNGDWYPWAPTVGGSLPRRYIEMWQHVRDLFTQQNVDQNIKWMWCVNAEDVGSYTAEQLYPGDRYVDWLAIDGYNWGQSQNWSSWESADEIYGDMLGRLRGIASKPVCIAEFASTSMTTSGYDPARKDDWIRSTLEYFEQQSVNMCCWFNEDKETDWAMFDGARGTETVAYNGEQVDAYTAFRKAVNTSVTVTNARTSETTSMEQPVSDY